MSALSQFMQAANAAQQEALARKAGTSRSYLYQLAAGDRTASAELAADIERASHVVRRGAGSLPIVPREQLCPACAKCEFLEAARA